MNTRLMCALAAALGTSSALAETKALDPHVHGIATMQIVQDGQALVINLDSPAASLLGFEHAPQTDAQHAAVDQLTVQLESFDGALLINASAACTVTDADIDVLAAVDHDDHGDEHHDEDGHGDEHHDDEHHDEDKHGDEHHDDEHHDDHADHDEEGSVHSEVNAAWTLTCASPADLATLDVLLFEGNAFLETVTAEVLLESGPLLQELTPGNTVLTFK